MNQQQKTSAIPDHAPRINALRALENNPHLNPQARACVDWLKAQGFTVLRVGRGPVITVQTSPLCEQLEGAVACYSRGPKGERRYHMVWRLDCQVCWSVAVADSSAVQPRPTPDNSASGLPDSGLRTFSACGWSVPE